MHKQLPETSCKMIQWQNCSFLWVHYLIFICSVLQTPSCHSPHISLKKIEKHKSHTFTTYIEFYLQHVQNKKKMLLSQVQPQIIGTNFNLKLCKWSKLVALTGACLTCFVTYSVMLILTVQLASRTSNFISHPVYLKMSVFFPSNRWMNLCTLTCVFTSLNSYTHLSTANKTGKWSKHFSCVFHKNKA